MRSWIELTTSRVAAKHTPAEEIDRRLAKDCKFEIQGSPVIAGGFALELIILVGTEFIDPIKLLIQIG